jgi:hypothetical protein
MIRSHLACGVHRNELIVRLDPDRKKRSRDSTPRPMDLTGRQMRAFITGHPDGLRGDRLNRWVGRGRRPSRITPAK